MTGSKLTSEAIARNKWRPRIAGLVTGFLALLSIQYVGPDALSQPVFDRWQMLFPRSLDKTRVAVVWIDERSIKSIGPWPWSRYMMARLTEEVAKRGAAVIGMDILFPEQDRQNPADFVALYPELSPASAAEIRQLPSMDTVFAKVVGQSPVVLGRAGLDAKPAPGGQHLAVEAAVAGALPDGVRTWPRAFANILEIDDVAAGHGFLNADPDEDGTIRRIPLVATVEDQPTPGFALELARVAMGADTVVPYVRDGKLTSIGLGDRRIATGPDGTMRLHFGILPESRNFSAIDLLDRTTPARSLDKRIVIIGLKGVGTADLVSTPLSSKVYGSSVQAEAVDAILSGAGLSRPRWIGWAELGLALLLSCALVFTLSRVRPAIAVLAALTVGGVVIATSLFAFTAQELLFDPVRPLLVAFTAGLATLLFLFGEGRRAQFRLERALLKQQLIAARSAGELSAAREIQLGMLPTRDSLQNFDAHVEVDGLIEPARSIGGDFYDVIRLNAHRICFLIGDVTGKGVPAALFMALSKALTKSVLMRDSNDLGAAVGRLNNEIARDNAEDMFVTMFIGVVDTRTGTLDMCNAGHENPYRVGATGEVASLESDGGPPLGVVPGFVYASERIQLADGDAVVIVSDGITEAQNPKADFFGVPRLIDVLAAWANQGNIGDVCNAVQAEVRRFEFGGEATDDLTILAFRYRAHRTA